MGKFLYFGDLLNSGAKRFLQREDNLSGLHFYRLPFEGWSLSSVVILGMRDGLKVLYNVPESHFQVQEIVFHLNMNLVNSKDEFTLKKMI